MLIDVYISCFTMVQIYHIYSFISHYTKYSYMSKCSLIFIVLAFYIISQNANSCLYQLYYTSHSALFMFMLIFVISVKIVNARLCVSQ